MAEMTLDETKLKEILKTAIIELLQENQGLVSDLMAEFIEDIALVNAIKEGENTETVSEDVIFKLLESKK